MGAQATLECVDADSALFGGPAKKQKTEGDGAESKAYPAPRPACLLYTSDAADE